MKLMSFEDALKESPDPSKRHLLLGNGFSIACRPNIFVYGKLFEQADFSKFSPSTKKAFEILKTQDFERVIKILRDSSKVLKAYEYPSKELIKALKADADGLRELLVETIAASHPEWPGELTDGEFCACNKFLSNFKTLYTLNYDLLLYWVQMHTEQGTGLNTDDGFRKPEDDPYASYVTWEPENSYGQNTWFLHGALHLFDAEIEIQKYTWSNTGVRLIEQIRDALKKDYFPIFVSEGTSNEKWARIRHNDYLAKAYRSFSSIGNTLFIYGHSLAENDEHYLKCIERGRLKSIYIGIYGDPSADENKKIISRANRLNVPNRRSNLDIRFFDSGSAQVWG